MQCLELVAPPGVGLDHGQVPDVGPPGAQEPPDQRGTHPAAADDQQARHVIDLDPS